MSKNEGYDLVLVSHVPLARYNYIKEWKAPKKATESAIKYNIGDYVYYKQNSKLYKCIQTHTVSYGDTFNANYFEETTIRAAFDENLDIAYSTYSKNFTYGSTNTTITYGKHVLN